MDRNDKFREECGVFGISGHPEAVKYTIVGLAALQHRGQESSGIAAIHEGQIKRVCSYGSVANLAAERDIKTLNGSSAIGHVRYSTIGESNLTNAQPLLLECPQGQVALCHNGQIVNFEDVKSGLQGVTWLTTSDSELLLQLCKISEQRLVIDAVIESLACLKGAFALLLLTKDELIAVRDPHGFRPLCMGRLDKATIVCSETCALDAVGAEYIGEVAPGEINVIGRSGISSTRYSFNPERAHCIFEHVYFSRPDSYVFGDHVGTVRSALGRALAREAPVEADVVVPIPESGMWSALGYQAESGLPLRLGLVRNAYMGRIFIEPHIGRRHDGRKLKLNPVPAILKGMRVVLIDDSIVRGETIARIVQDVRSAGAKEVHVRIGSPPTIGSCFYGINTPDKSELIAATRSVSEVQTMIGADSLQYLSLEGLLEAVGKNKSNYCTACYTGNYRVWPPALPRPISKEYDVPAVAGAAAAPAKATRHSPLIQLK